MAQSKPLIDLPPAEELPYSDGKPVDSKLQILIPARSRTTIARIRITSTTIPRTVGAIYLIDGLPLKPVY